MTARNLLVRRRRRDSSLPSAAASVRLLFWGFGAAAVLLFPLLDLACVVNRQAVAGDLGEVVESVDLAA
ncbi:hypothetical protein OG936_37670 [Streptomyces sp. NBC_00846]|uniref:hypothetical protein n=1 Tax=Streptomyces sp. NBC_00846 TaxID=2975849 RepID=UPI0038658392|nr:hypothetical protein OG936_37670 [Streptomyces sp. NBC_00846]